MDKTKSFIEKHYKEVLVGVGIVIFYQLGYKRGFRSGIKFEDALMSLVGGKK